MLNDRDRKWYILCEGIEKVVLFGLNLYVFVLNLWINKEKKWCDCSCVNYSLLFIISIEWILVIL